MNNIVETKTQNKSCFSSIFDIIKIIFWAFIAYICIYFIKLPLFVPTYHGLKCFGGLDLKVAFAISQCFGFFFCKFPATVYAPRLIRSQWCKTLIILGVCAQISLLGLLFTINEIKVIAVFISAFLLSPIYSIMLRYMEGRLASELIISIFSASYIGSSGVTKSVSTYVISLGVNDSLMPIIIGFSALLIYIPCIILLDRSPNPSNIDVERRLVRQPCTTSEQNKFCWRWLLGIIFLCLIFVLVSILRTIRDYFAPEIWSSLLSNSKTVPSLIYTESEVPVCIISSIIISCFSLIRDNSKAFYIIIATMGLGFLLIILSIIFYIFFSIPPLVMMIGVGTGIYLGSIPPGAILFDRFMAISAECFTTTFIVLRYDAVLYFGIAALLLYRQFSSLEKVNFLVIYEYFGIISSIIGILLCAFSILYFWIKLRRFHSFQILSDVDTKEKDSTEEESDLILFDSPLPQNNNHYHPL